MRMKTLHDVLLVTPRDPHRRPLFHSQVDLATAVRGIQAAGFDKPEQSEASVRNFINQVLNHRRPVSRNLRKAILAAVRQRAASNPDLPHILEDLDVAFDAHTYDDSVTDALLTNKRLNEEIQRTSQNASEYCIITYKPAETIQSPTAERLRDILLDNLGFNDEPDSPKRQVVCRFYVRDDVVALNLWNGIHMRLTHRNSNDFRERLKMLDEEDRLQVYVIDACYCLYPTLVFDPARPTASGFVFFYHGLTGVSICKMAQDALELWKEKIYFPLLYDRIKFPAERVRYQEYLKRLCGKNS
jgi:hypothetical protein